MTALAIGGGRECQLPPNPGVLPLGACSGFQLGDLHFPPDQLSIQPGAFGLQAQRLVQFTHNHNLLMSGQTLSEVAITFSEKQTGKLS